MPAQNWDSLDSITKAMIKNMKQYSKTGTVTWDYKIALADLCYQSGHLMKLKMQLDNERHHQEKTKKILKNEIQMELAEVVALSLFIAHELDLDIKKGFSEMLKQDSKKIKKRSLHLRK